MNDKKVGSFVISLDFEMIWGVFDKINPTEKLDYFQSTRELIPKVLNIFAEYNVHATWAIVGMLFNENWEEWEKNFPDELPQYKIKELSAYEFGRRFKAEENEFLCFAKKLIKLIDSYPGQEIGTHTYSHYYCLEEGQTIASFKADIAKSMEIAKKLDIVIKSLVFPRNQYNEEYLQVCVDLGIENVRSNPTSWYWKDTQKESLLSKVFRTGDAYLGFNNKSYSIQDATKNEDIIFAQKASRLLRPYSPNQFLNRIKLKRIKSEMVSAAKKGEVYHLWWHPHNFGNHTEENLQDLREILECFKMCNTRYGFSSKNMMELQASIA